MSEKNEPKCCTCSRCNKPKLPEQMVKGRKVCKKCENERVKSFYKPKEQLVSGVGSDYFTKQPFGWVF